MKIEWNCAGGDTVFLKAKDSLDDVPESHRGLITPAIRSAFRDPCEHFRTVASRCRFPVMRRYLEDLTKTRRWELRLHSNGYDSPGIGAFAFVSSSVVPGEIAPANAEKATNYPREIAEFYSLIDWMHWSVYGGAGGLERAGRHDPLIKWPEFCGDAVDPSATFEWGSTGCGDLFIYSADGRAGMLCHENCFVHLIGTVAETIDWIFSKLCRQELPEFDYQWCK